MKPGKLETWVGGSSVIIEASTPHGPPVPWTWVDGRTNQIPRKKILHERMGQWWVNYKTGVPPAFSPQTPEEFFGIHLSRISKVQLHWDLFFSIGGAIQGAGHKKVYFFYDNHITPHLIHGFTPARLHGNPHSNSTLFNYSVNLRCAAAGGLICLCS